MVWTQESCHKYVNYDHPGECSPEKDCLWWLWLTFRQPERKSSSESSELWNVSRWRLTDKQPITSGLRWPISLTTRDVYTTYWRSTIHLTLKMTSAQVVETSVKVTKNSPSQDYTHPDDHNLRTYDMTPEFKPFTILRSFGRQSERLANNYIRYASNVRRIRQQLWFNHRCKDLGLVRAGLRLKSPLNTKEAIQIVKATCRRLIRARINDCHRRLNFYNNKLQQRLDKLKQLIPTNLLDTVLAIADKRANKTEEQHRNLRTFWLTKDGSKRTNHFLQSSQPITSRLTDKRPIISGLRWPISLTTRDVYTTYWRSTIHLTLKMTSAQVVETSVKVITNSPSQDYTHPDDHNLRTFSELLEYSYGQNITFFYSIFHFLFDQFSVRLLHLITFWSVMVVLWNFGWNPDIQDGRRLQIWEVTPFPLLFNYNSYEKETWRLHRASAIWRFVYVVVRPMKSYDANYTTMIFTWGDILDWPSWTLLDSSKLGEPQTLTKTTIIRTVKWSKNERDISKS